jgi:hypothetical protein
VSGLICGSGGLCLYLCWSWSCGGRGVGLGCRGYLCAVNYMLRGKVRKAYFGEVVLGLVGVTYVTVRE